MMMQLSQIVKILNDHLSSLQWIDSHTNSMVSKFYQFFSANPNTNEPLKAEKINEAQKKARDGATGALGGDEDYFPSSSYRSMR